LAYTFFFTYCATIVPRYSYGAAALDSILVMPHADFIFL
jgi:hypothetical protein